MVRTKNHYLCCDVEDSMQKSYLIQNEENIFFDKKSTSKTTLLQKQSN